VVKSAMRACIEGTKRPHIPLAWTDDEGLDGGGGVRCLESSFNSAADPEQANDN
jgi:hypothetical protein